MRLCLSAKSGHFQALLSMRRSHLSTLEWVVRQRRAPHPNNSPDV
jgi:hypothetical protein